MNKKDFLIQLIFALGFCGAQIIHMFEATNGISVVLFSSFAVFMAIHWNVAYSSKTFAGEQDIWLLRTYRIWTCACVCMLVFALYCGAFQSINLRIESITLLLICISMIVLLFCKKHYSLPFTHAYIKGWISAILKATPQLMLIPTILYMGIDGWSFWTVGFGHVTVWMRVYPMYKSEKTKTKEEKTIFYAELANGISWLLFTVVLVFLFFTS